MGCAPSTRRRASSAIEASSAVSEPNTIELDRPIDVLPAAAAAIIQNGENHSAQTAQRDIPALERQRSREQQLATQFQTHTFNHGSCGRAPQLATDPNRPQEASEQQQHQQTSTSDYQSVGSSLTAGRSTASTALPRILSSQDGMGESKLSKSSVSLSESSRSVRRPSRMSRVGDVLLEFSVTSTVTEDLEVL